MGVSELIGHSHVFELFYSVAYNGVKSFRKLRSITNLSKLSKFPKSKPNGDMVKILGLSDHCGWIAP